jgi:hypothetical protein
VRIRASILIVGALIAVAAAFLLPARQASAVPSFAREHGLKCSECHVAFPRLNEFGMEFKQRGYRLPGKEGKFVWEQNTLPLSVVALAKYINQHEDDPVTKARTLTQSRFELQEVAFFAAGTAAPKIGYLVDAVAPVSEGGPFAVEQGWVQFSDLVAASTLNLRAGKMQNEYFYLSQLRRLTLQPYLAPITFNVTGVELNGQRWGFRYAGGVVNDERQPGSTGPGGAPVNPPAVNVEKKVQGFYGWATYTLAEQILGVRYINTKANSDNPSPVIDGRTRQQLDANLLLRYGPAELLLGYFHNWDIGGVNGQDRRNYLVEGIGEILQDKLFVDARFEFQDTGSRPGGNNPARQNGKLVAVNVSYYVVPNVRVMAEFSKQRGEGLSVFAFLDPNSSAAMDREQYIVGLQMGF